MSPQPMSAPRRVLAAQLGDELTRALAPALGRAEFDLNVVPSAHSATELARLLAFDLILVGCSGPDSDIDELIAAIRDPASPSISAQLLLFASPGHQAAAESYVARGASQVFGSSQPPLALQESILKLLRARPRLATRVMARLTVRLGDDSSRFLCQTRDLSATGMLAVTENRYPIGTSVRFVLELPGERDGVEGDAEVVRHAVRERDQIEGLGLRFSSIRAGGESHLAAFLARNGA